MKKVYGYCRISTSRQNIERQVRNILADYPKAKIVKETYTGTKFQGRKELDKLLKKIKPGDTIVFDSVSRMSRNAEEGFQLYEGLYNRNVNLVFLKEKHINTDTYKQEIDNQLDIPIDTGDTDTNELMKSIVLALNKYILSLAKRQIILAFQQSEKEVEDLRQRTKEGIETARRAGKQIGQKEGNHLNVKKAIEAKIIILKHNKTFGGVLTDKETQIQAHISRNSLYKYKKELVRDIEHSSFEEVEKKYLDLCGRIRNK